MMPHSFLSTILVFFVAKNSAKVRRLILAFSVVREKFFMHRRDPYEKEVTR